MHSIIFSSDGESSYPFAIKVPMVVPEFKSAAKSMIYTSQRKEVVFLGGSPGLVVMVGDSCSEGHGFEIQHGILNGHLLYRL